MPPETGSQLRPVIQSDLRTVYCASALAGLAVIPDESVQCCVTSPPYWGLRDYGHADQLGLEKTPAEYVQKLVVVFSEVNRVLRKDGTLWLNLGDSYAASGKGGNPPESEHEKQATNRGPEQFVKSKRLPRGTGRWGGGSMPAVDCKPKDLVGIPWMAAFALRSAGWYLRSDIIWAKPNPMPESVTDRCTRSHEYIFQFSKSARYYYDHEAIKDPPSPDLIKQIEDGYNGHAIKDYLSASVQDASATKGRIINGYRKRIDKRRGHGRLHAGFNDKWDALTPVEQAMCGRNKRSVWTVAPASYREAHFATFPPKLIEPCILAGSKPGDTVLDPFAGSGTTGQVAINNHRRALLIELNPDYIPLINRRTSIELQPELAML
jgi:DNA modification methylase